MIMNIALINLSHMTVGVQTNTVPLGIGLIARYLQKNTEHKLDIRVFKDPDKFLRALKKWKPDVLGIAQYPWNSELNLYMAQLVKKYNPHCLVVAGGPNLYVSSEEKLEYLKTYDFVDVCVRYDGEVPFAEIIKRLAAGEKIEDIKRLPVESAYSLDASSGKLVQSNKKATRLNSLDTFGSMYADGFFDKFLDDGFHPFLQTQRGCPFTCAYCSARDGYHSRMVFQSVEYFKRDMEYLGKRFSGQHNTILYLANSNFGLFEADFEIARIIREMQDKYDWPRRIYVPSGKNKNAVLKLLSILKYKYSPSLSLQTLTPKVLKNIKRENLAFEDFIDFQKKIAQITDEVTTTELILNLPEETKNSFIDAVSRVLNSGVQEIAIWTLMALKGTPIASREIAKRYGHVIRHRLVPRCFSSVNGVKIFESEEVVVSTNSMPFEDYIDLRGLALIITLFAGSLEIFPVRKFLMEHDLDIANWIFDIHSRISDFPALNAVYVSFLRETWEELFPSRKTLMDFFKKEENFDLLCTGKAGDNLLRKYKAMVLSGHYKEYLELTFSTVKRLASQHFDPNLLDSLLNDLKSYVKTRDIGHLFKDKPNQTMSQDVMLQYDVPKWLSQREGSRRLEDYKGVCPYSTVMTDYIRDRLKSYMQMYRNPELSLHIIYCESFINDFWPL